MKRLLAVICVMIALVLVMSGCNVQIIDTTWKFDHAIISLPNGEIVEGSVTKWGDYENSDMIQVEIDGNTYLTHITNVVLINGKTKNIERNTNVDTVCHCFCHLIHQK